MKVVTDPAFGVTSCNLEQADRNKLAAAKTLLSEIAYHERLLPRGPLADSACDLIGEILAPADASPQGDK